MLAAKKQKTKQKRENNTSRNKINDNEQISYFSLLCFLTNSESSIQVVVREYRRCEMTRTISFLYLLPRYTIKPLWAKIPNPVYLIYRLPLNKNPFSKLLSSSVKSPPV